MSNWNHFDDKELKIGRAVRGGGTASNIPRTVRNNTERNALAKAGALTAQKKISGDPLGQKAAAMDRDTDPKLEKFSEASRKELQKARQNYWKGRPDKPEDLPNDQLSFKDLCEKLRTRGGRGKTISVQDLSLWESGKAIPTQQDLAKLEAILGVKLRGSNIGQPMGPKGKAKQ